MSTDNSAANKGGSDGPGRSIVPDSVPAEKEQQIRRMIASAQLDVAADCLQTISRRVDQGTIEAAEAIDGVEEALVDVKVVVEMLENQDE